MSRERDWRLKLRQQKWVSTKKRSAQKTFAQLKSKAARRTINWDRQLANEHWQAHNLIFSNTFGA
jgi:hypothetical protein